MASDSITFGPRSGRPNLHRWKGSVEVAWTSLSMDHGLEGHATSKWHGHPCPWTHGLEGHATSCYFPKEVAVEFLPEGTRIDYHEGVGARKEPFGNHDSPVRTMSEALPDRTRAKR
jgi:hypothetical protein